MRSLLALFIGLAFLGLWPAMAFAWAREGHEVIARIAERLISPATRAKTNQLLAEGGDVSLVSVACWADELVLAARREGPLNEDSEAQEFNRKFPNNRTWHFVNLPLGTLSFEEARRFTSADSIARAISRCIQVLEAPLPDLQEFTKVQALRLLVHFVGDVHQPLHCGTGYYSLDSPGRAELITFPEEAFGKPNDRGGNLLFYGTTPTEQLHAFWDAVIVEAIHNTGDPAALADFLLRNAGAEERTKTPGDFHGWAEAWAIESVRIATLAYLGIIFQKAEVDADKNLLRIDIELPVNYLNANRAYAAQQLTKAGGRLAQLLDSINWPSVAEP
jgi:hypothetical protein